MKVKVVCHDTQEYVVDVDKDFDANAVIAAAREAEEDHVAIGKFSFHIGTIARIVPAQ